MRKKERLLLATRNAHKVREIARLLSGLPLETVGLDDCPEVAEVVEDRPTIEGNARKKAAECALASGLWSLADDTGLEVEALSGAPGVLSARYAGPGCDYAANNRKLLDALEGVPAGGRRAVFRTVMALSDPGGSVTLEEGRLEGEIVARPRGDGGFGYDPVFLVPAEGKTLAEMSLSEKNALSHRARALERILPHIKRRLLGLAAAALLLARPASAGRTEPGQETIWDQIMASQANRDLRVGSRYLDEQRYDQAVKEFSRAVAANPKDPTAQMMLGVAYYWTGEVDKSLESYRKSLELDGSSAQAYMLIGISLAWKGDSKASYESFKKASQLDPARPDIQMNLGSIEEGLGMIPESLDHFRRAISLDPRQPLYQFQLGTLYRKLGRDQDAVEALQQALKLYPQFEDALLELGAVDERRGERKAAIHSFRKAVDLKARDSVARFRLGRLYLLTEDSRKARDVLADSFHLTPEAGGAGLQLSVSYAGGKTQAAAPEGGGPEPAKPAQKAPESNDPLDVYARSLERIPLEQSAVMQVEIVFVPKPKLVKASPESPSSLKKALAEQLGAEGAGPTAVRRDYQLRSAGADQRSGQIAKILEDLRAVMKQAPPDSDVRLGMNLTFTKLAGAASGAGAGAGRADSESAPKVSYQPREVGNDMGLWVIGTGWMALVEEMLPEPGEKTNHPDQSDWWVVEGLGYATLGAGDKALAAFERACELDPKNEAALLGRGVAFVMTGNESAAIASYREAVKINPKNRAAAEGLKWLLRPSTKRGAVVGGGR